MVVLFLLLPLLHLSSGNLNLYLDQEEVKRLLGLENQLFYVQDGAVKQNAIGYLIPVPSWIDVLHFTWYISPPYTPLNYKLSLSSSDSDIISVPRVNISKAGSVPSIPQVWGVNVACSGRKSGIVVITIDIILSQLDVNKLTNTTLLSFKRTKECQLFFVETLDRNLHEDGEDTNSRSYVLFFTSIGGCVVFLFIIFTAVMVTWWKRRSRRKYSSVSTSAHDHNQKSVSQSFLDSSHATTAVFPPVPPGGGGDSRNSSQLGAGGRYGLEDGLPVHSGAFAAYPISVPGQRMLQVDQGQITLSSQQQYPTSPVLPPPVDVTMYRQAPHRKIEEVFTSDAESKYRFRYNQPPPPIEEIAVDRLSLTLGELLLEGTFGRIYQGRLDNRGDTKDVMVKTVVMGSSMHQSSNLVSESERLYGVSHKHVLPLVATTSDGSSPMMIYAYTNPGNLKKWLISSGHQALSTHQCVMLGLQLLTALKHLHKRHIIHSDVATRNCYLTGQLSHHQVQNSGCSSVSVRLADSSLSRDIFPNDYHCLGDNENRPVKWMAVECITGQKEYTPASDVWSWGVTLWEILTRGQQPFPDVDPFEMETYLMDGFRLHQPVNCPDQLYSVMASCWAHNPAQRSGVHALYNNLAAFSSELQQFV